MVATSQWVDTEYKIIDNFIDEMQLFRAHQNHNAAERAAPAARRQICEWETDSRRPHRVARLNREGEIDHVTCYIQRLWTLAT